MYSIRWNWFSTWISASVSGIRIFEAFQMWVFSVAVSNTKNEDYLCCKRFHWSHISLLFRTFHACVNNKVYNMSGFRLKKVWLIIPHFIFIKLCEKNQLCIPAHETVSIFQTEIILIVIPLLGRMVFFHISQLLNGIEISIFGRWTWCSNNNLLLI